MWLNDQTVRSAVRHDLEATVRSTGLEFDEAEWAALRSLDWTMSDEELLARNNQGSYGSSDCA